MAYVRKVRTASGAVAVQVARKDRGRVEILAHVGSAHTNAELGILLDEARQILRGEQEALQIEVPVPRPLSAPVRRHGPVSPTAVYQHQRCQARCQAAQLGEPSVRR